MMKLRNLIFAVLFAAASAFGQISGAGQLGCNSSPVTGTGWTTATSVNSTQTLATYVAGATITVVLDQTSTLTVGAVSFQEDYGDGTPVTVSAWQVLDPTSGTFAAVSLPYTLQASTNKVFQIQMGGAYKLILKLTTAITGSATVTPYTNINCYSAPQQVLVPAGAVVSQSTAANLNAAAVGTKTNNNAAPSTTNMGTLPCLANAAVQTWTEGNQVSESCDLSGNQRVVTGATPVTGNAASTSYTAAGASTNATNVKNAAGNVYSIVATNTTTTAYYLRLYNLSSAPTCSSATGFVETIPVGGATAGQVGGFVRTIEVGQAFSTGVGFCITGGSGSTDNTNAAVGVYVSVLYK